MSGNEVTYRVRNYCGSDTTEPEFWHLKELDGKYIFEYYPRKEMMDQTWQFMYAYNREDCDIYDCIITDENPSIEGDPKHSGAFLNSAFYRTLRNMHREYGDMKLGYVRYNDVVYSSVPYVEGLGFFSWKVFNSNDRMHSIIRHPFDGGERKVLEFIKTDEREPEDLFAYIPKLSRAVPLPPVAAERFAVQLYFDNGECRKYAFGQLCEGRMLLMVFDNVIIEQIAIVAGHLQGGVSHEPLKGERIAATIDKVLTGESVAERMNRSPFHTSGSVVLYNRKPQGVFCEKAAKLVAEQVIRTAA